MKPESMLEGMLRDCPNFNKKAENTLNRLYRKRNYGGAETWALRNHIVPEWIKLKTGVDIESWEV